MWNIKLGSCVKWFYKHYRLSNIFSADYTSEYRKISATYRNLNITQVTTTNTFLHLHSL